MDIKKFKENLEVEQIIFVMEKLGATYKTNGKENELQFSTICHGGDSHKLYFYKDSKSFHCYTSCGQMDIINVVEKVLNLTTGRAIQTICRYLGISGSHELKYGFDKESIINELEELLKYDDVVEIDTTRDFKLVNAEILEKYDKLYHPSFYKDGIKYYTMDKFGIRYDILNQRIIIPHHDELGNLIAIRCRNTLQELIDEGKKYMPIYEGKELLSAPTSKYFYGLNENKENIKKLKKVILVEAEKSVMQLDTILKDNIAIALMGSSISLLQVMMLKELGANEVIIALDKEFLEVGTKEERLYQIKLKRAIIDKLYAHFNISIIWDTTGLIGYKESPTDKGKSVFYKLYENRIKYN